MTDQRLIKAVMLGMVQRDWPRRRPARRWMVRWHHRLHGVPTHCHRLYRAVWLNEMNGRRSLSSMCSGGLGALLSKVQTPKRPSFESQTAENRGKILGKGTASCKVPERGPGHSSGRSWFSCILGLQKSQTHYSLVILQQLTLKNDFAYVLHGHDSFWPHRTQIAAGDTSQSRWGCAP